MRVPGRRRRISTQLLKDGYRLNSLETDIDSTSPGLHTFSLTSHREESSHGMTDGFDLRRNEEHEGTQARKLKNGAPGWGRDSVSDVQCVRSAGVAREIGCGARSFFGPVSTRQN